MASNTLDSVMVYQYTSDQGFQMLHADRQSQPVTRCSAVHRPLPSHATVAAVDERGAALFLAPELQNFGPECNMYTAVHYNLGQALAGIVQGTLCTGPDSQDLGRRGSQVDASSAAWASAHQEVLPASAAPALPALGGARGLPGASVGLASRGDAVPAVHHPATSRRPEGICRPC